MLFFAVNSRVLGAACALQKARYVMHDARSESPARPSPSLASLLRDRRGAVYVEHLVMVAVGLMIAFVLEAAGEVLLTHFTGLTTGLYRGVP